MSTNHTIKGRVFDFDCCPYVEFWGYCMLGMCDVRDVGCSGCGMLEMWDVGDVGCSGCGMFGMWDVRDVGCGMFAGMWDVHLQNADKALPNKLNKSTSMFASISPCPCFTSINFRLGILETFIQFSFTNY